MAAHRRLLVSARGHTDRRVLAGREAAARRVGCRSRRRPLSGAWLTEKRPLAFKSTARTRHRRKQRPHLLGRIIRAHDATHHCDADRAGHQHFGGAGGVEAADRENWNLRGACDLAEAYASDLWAVTGFALGLAGGLTR